MLKGRERAWFAVLIAAAVSLVPMQSANAALSNTPLYGGWSNPLTFLDPAGDVNYIDTGSNTSPASALDIIGADRAITGTSTFFRLDLLTDFTPPPAAWYTDQFAIYIDQEPNKGALLSDWQMVLGVPGIGDGVVDRMLLVWPAHINGGHVRYLKWDGTKWVFDEAQIVPSSKTVNLAGNVSYEWQIDEQLDGQWWGVTNLTGVDSNSKITYDYVATPIPGAVWLLGSGLAGLVGIGRWRRRK